MPPARKTPGEPSREKRGRRDDVATSVDAFRRVLRELRLAARKTEMTTGLSAAQLFVLSAVAATPGCSVNEIAVVTMTDRSSAAAIVDRLVEQGFVTRERAGEDRRRASIAMTDRGRRATGKAPVVPTALLIAGLRSLTAKQLGELARGLVALTHGMGVAEGPAGMLFEDSKPRRTARAR